MTKVWYHSDILTLLERTAMLSLIFTSLLTVSSAQCPATKIVGKDKYGWNAFDQQILNKAKKRCREIYPKSPCVKIFKKIGEQDYLVVCGALAKEQDLFD